MFVMQTPAPSKMKTKEGTLEVCWNPNFGHDMTEKINKKQEYIDSECLRLCDPMVPKDTGNLKQSGLLHTRIGTGQIVYRTVYARRWYYMPATFQEAPMRGNYWFERMKQQYRNQILKGAAKI